jgi:SAM-dependent methyltransferase
MPFFLKISKIEEIMGHYDQKYFEWQKSVGEFGGWANKTKYEKYISKDDVVLDFGCGGGFLLKNIDCAKKIGVEINPTAAETAKSNSIEVYSCTKDVPDECIDTIISNNALEHTHHPLDELKELYKKLKKNGKIIFVVPCENICYTYKPNDINQHLYSWSPMCIGNLFTLAGFNVIESQPYIHKWPPHYMKIARLGRKIFDIVCGIYGQYERTWFQVRIIAQK